MRWLDRLSERQTTFLVLGLGALLYLPLAGSYGLWDPWETHYGEVGRQMVERGDVISLYWPGSPLDREFFWSKPVLTFWLIALSMWLFGLRGAAPGELALGTTTEWALRVPFCLIALTALYGVYLVGARLAGRRAGVLAALVLATMPMFSLIARQAMTDMPFVGPMTLGLACAVLALFDEDTRALPRRRWRRLSWPHHRLFYVTLGLLACTALPQLIAFSVQLTWRFKLGETRLVLPGVLVMVPYLAGFVLCLRQIARAEVRAPLYLYLAAVLAALALLAKGLAGLGLPVLVLLCYLVFTGNGHRLLRPALVHALWPALLACAVVAVPWHHAMLVRHGAPFWNELYGDNHWKRMVSGRHGDRGTFEYFLRELGYAVLPWLPLAPAALGYAVQVPARATGADAGRRDAFWLGAIWFAVAYALVSLSMTKFHHYLLPALPGLALALGCLLDELLRQPRGRLARLVPLAGLPLFGLVLLDLTHAPKDAQRFLWLFNYDYINTPGGRPWPPALDYTVALFVFAALWSLAALGLRWGRLRAPALLLTGAGALAFTAFLLGVFMPQTSRVWTQKRLIGTYYRMRASPEERLVAWQMYWRGETFYTQNEIYEGPADTRTVFLGNRNAEDLQAWVARNPGRRAFFVVERSRLEGLKRLLPAGARDSFTVVDDSNNKFLLATVNL